MLNDFEVKQEFLENYRYAHDFWAPYIEDAKVYSLAQSGFTWSNSERKQLVKDGREPLEFNIMRRPIQFYSGYLRDNINSIVISPVEGSDQETADQLDEISKLVWNKGFPVFLDACDEMFKSGISLCGLRMDYSKDFINGDIAFYKRTFNSFYLDPTFESLDLKDCGFVIMRDLLDKSQAKALLPFIDQAEIDDIQTGFRDDKFLSYHPQFVSFSRNRNLMAYDQYYRRKTRSRKMLIDRRSGFFRDITELEDEEIDKLEKGIHRFERLKKDSDELGLDKFEIPDVEIKSVERPYIELNIMLNSQQVYVGEDKTGITEMYPFAPIVCYMEPSLWMPSQRIQGIASTQWSIQRQFNKRHMKIIDMMDSTIATGFKYLLGTVPDPTDMQQSGQNKLIGVDPENNPAGLAAVEELHGGAANPSLVEYQKVLDDLSLTLANINESVLGIDEKGNTQVSGRLAQVRIAQGLRSNRKVFDNIEVSQQIIGSLVLLAIQKNYPPEKIERMINQTPTEQFYESEFEQYDAIIKEGVRSKSQKDAYYYELVNLSREGIVDVPQAEIVRALQMSGLSDLEKAIEEQDKQKAEQQQKIDQQEQMVLKLEASKIEANTGLAQERRARVISDIALGEERASEAEENRAQAALARAKTITEIASMQDERILKVLEFVNLLEQQEAADREQVNAEIFNKADAINSETQGSAENKQLQQASEDLAPQIGGE
jgi:hypothetical protein